MSALSHALHSLLHDGPVWLQVGHLIDGTSAPQSDAHVVLDAEQIRFVGTALSMPPPECIKPGQQAPDLVLEGHTLLPGLIDGHTHIFLEGGELDFEKRKAYQVQTPEALLEASKVRCEHIIQHGVIAMRDGGDKDGVGLSLSAQKGTTCAADVYSPGPGINRLKRYGRFFCEPFEDFDSATEVVHNRIQRGADHIKIVPTGIINFAKATVVAKPQYTLEEIQALTQAAHAEGKHVMAHASGTEGVGLAIDGGVDTIEHGYFISEDQLGRMAERGSIWVPTFAPVQKQVDHANEMGWNDVERDNLNKILEGHARSLQRGLELGVRILVGSDAGSCGVAHVQGLFYEMELLEKAGMPTLDILQAATAGNAEYLLGAPPYGQIKPGMKARIALTEYNPLKSVRELQKAKTVIVDGQVFDSAEAPCKGF